MADSENLDPTLSGMDPNRRDFLKKMAIGAVAAPVVASFSMVALSSQQAAFASNTSVSNVAQFP